MRSLRKSFNVAPRRGPDNARVLAELESQAHALKAKEVAALLGVTAQHIYKLAAQQQIPSFRVGGAVRFDPAEVADWLRRKMPQAVSSSPSAGIAEPGVEARIAV
jgi:excisionase family DNA binding protein